MTLIEILVASGLLIVLTMAFFQILAPALRRTVKIDRRQENLQRFILFKEYLTKRMGNVRLIADTVGPTSLEFYLPDQVDTAEYGPVNVVKVTEMIYWNENIKNRITIPESGDKNRIITEIAGEKVRPLWNLGPSGEVTFSFDRSGIPQLTTEITITDEKEPMAAPWKNSFKVYIKNFI